MKKKWYLFVFTLLLLTSLPFSTAKVIAGSYGSADGLEWQNGPATISLDGIATINVPDNFAFFDEENAKRFMQENSPPPNGSEIGALYNMKMQLFWNVIFEYHNTGYINDSDKSDLDADELLESYQQSPEGQREKATAESKSSVLRWDVEPKYEEDKHQLRYSLGWRDSLQSGLVKYKVNFLTREGYFSVILVTTSHKFEESQKQFEDMVLQHITINNGHTYEEFNASVDKKSELGLTNLIPGGDKVASTKKSERVALLIRVIIFIVAASAVASISIALYRKQKHRQPIASLSSTELTEAVTPTHIEAVDQPHPEKHKY
ncbi:DUF2167 domain-containing protein [Paenibacillus barcinonensis]|uniref:DUF2167 domain-containing protein n=1 Tax=Paenibacillus barcinonensis TaxID=198119 RepID=A0A2V4VP99_PAEBA|nr:DUF2167 domain-containing protein [Paenibacillus barcinonensis]PYE48194.1 putative membrane-anchored protein [Paenibacillus barcinonensis]QKS56953.1 DUF2167 domain-containing protein [Paenibacillus barcinonensis]